MSEAPFDVEHPKFGTVASSGAICWNSVGFSGVGTKDLVGIVLVDGNPLGVSSVFTK